MLHIVERMGHLYLSYVYKMVFDRVGILSFDENVTFVKFYDFEKIPKNIDYNFP